MKNLRIVGILFIVIVGCAFYFMSATSNVSREDPAVAERQRQAKAAGLAAETQRLILESKVAIGMTALQVEAAWGEPKRINRTLTAHGKTEQWVYRSGYLYLDDDILRSIQTSH